MSIKIILDTDIGSDVDDAICLAYLLAQPKCELLGITTVTGESDKRAMLASILCKAAGKHVPIFPGIENPLLVPLKQKQVAKTEALQKWDHDELFPKGEAVEFLRQTIRKYPGEVILLTIGPLSNIGLLFSVDPEIPSLLKGLVMMCGFFTNRQKFGIRPLGELEWNAIGDPHATAIVYRAVVNLHRSIGLDVTKQVTMNASQVKEKFNCDRLRPIIDFTGDCFQRKHPIIFHDPLAAATIFDDQICTFEKGTVDVELVSEKLKGMTLWSPGGPEIHEVALGVDSKYFFEHYFSVFK